MKKQLNTEGITNELAGASAFFTRPPPPPQVWPVKTDDATKQPRTAPAEQPATASRQSADSRPTEPTTTALPEQPTSKQTSMKASSPSELF